MKTFLFGIFFIPMLSFAQQGYLAIEPAVYFKSASTPALGIHFSGNGKLGKTTYAGLQMGIVKFQELSKNYIPIQAKFSIIPSEKLGLLFTIEPGYGVYKLNSTTGGFVFYGGVGLVFPSSKNGRGFLTVGYSNFGFQTAEAMNNVECLGVHFGFMVR
jgi:hypothetical protein